MYGSDGGVVECVCVVFQEFIFIAGCTIASLVQYNTPNVNLHIAIMYFLVFYQPALNLNMQEMVALGF